MSDVTVILAAIEQGDQEAASKLLPLLYDELRYLAAQKLAGERPGQTLEPTALVHEAYLRLVASDPEKRWDGRGHFFAAAAEAMRRILVENARKKSRKKRGGNLDRRDFDPEAISAPERDEYVIDLDEALEKLAKVDPPVAELVKLRYFVGMTIPQAADVLGISPRTADFHWKYAKAWLREEMKS